MARKRMIDPNIWQSEDFSKLSTLAKLVFIGLFSLADDEGRGRSNPVYLKSNLFPYEEGIRSADIDKTLSEISSNMSVIFYSCDGSNYYSLYNWNTWQKIDKPSKSKIPEYDEKTMQKIFDDNSTNVRRTVSPNIKEKEKNNNEQKQILLEHFNLIWEKYPNKKGKAKAIEYYLQWIKGRTIAGITRKLTDEQMYYAVVKYQKECEKNGIEQQFIKHGDTFFNKAILDYVEVKDE